MMTIGFCPIIVFFRESPCYDYCHYLDGMWHHLDVA
jgi:hypothetical protein